MRTSLVAFAASALLITAALPLSGKDKPRPNWNPNWVTGTITEINQEYNQTAWRNTTSSNGTETSSRYGIHYVDYSVQVENRAYVLRSLPIKQPHETRSSILRWATGMNSPEQASPNLPVMVGDKLRVAIEGTAAWLEVGKSAYPCTVLRQVLLSIPDTQQAAPQNGPAPTSAQSPDSADKAP
jgi:hypothetical protein